LACPYAERKGPIVVCQVIGKKVNPISYPCLTDRYQRCKFYKKARAPEVRPASKPEQVIEKKIEPILTVKPTPKPTVATPRRETISTKGLTLYGGKPSNCTECIYYGAKTNTCLLLSIEITNPHDPPCTKINKLK